jgi:hypothetical protein
MVKMEVRQYSEALNALQTASNQEIEKFSNNFTWYFNSIKPFIGVYAYTQNIPPR